MQVSVDTCCKRSIDAFHTGNFSLTGGLQPAQATEMTQQCGPPAWTDAGDIFQPAGRTCLLPAGSMAGDGKAMGLVAHLLDELQARAGGTRAQAAPVRQYQGFLTGTSLWPLGHTYQDHPLHPQGVEHGLGLRQLAGTAVDEQHIRQHPVLRHRPG